jgi:hypothetical protein
MFLDTCGEYISTNRCGNVLDAQGAMPNAPMTPSNVGAILGRNHYYSMNQSNIAS